MTDEGDPRRYTMRLRIPDGKILTIDRATWAQISSWFQDQMEPYADRIHIGPPPVVEAFTRWPT